MKSYTTQSLQFSLIVRYVFILLISQLVLGVIFYKLNSKIIIYEIINPSLLSFIESTFAFMLTTLVLFFVGKTHTAKPYVTGFFVVYSVLFLSSISMWLILGVFYKNLFVTDLFTSFIAVLIGITVGIRKIKRDTPE